MQYYHKNISSRILSFIGFGISLILILIGIVFFSYVLIIGAILGLILFGLSTLINLFRPSNPISRQHGSQRSQQPRQRRVGRTFDHDDL